jgi:hypothetical protein
MSNMAPDTVRERAATHDWQSALLLPVPAAEPAVAEQRARWDASARDGVPAHLTVLYPFLPPGLIDGAVLTSLRQLFAGFPAFAFTLDRVAWFGQGVLWLGPRDATPFCDLIARAREAFPQYPPYGGRYAEVIPHLTVGDRGGAAALRTAENAVRPFLPVEAAATEVVLMAGPPPGNPDTPPGQWRRLASFPFRPC